MTGDHTYHEDCSSERCFICNGGLAACTVCGGIEDSLPTECPGVEMTIEQLKAREARRLDFIDGKWKTYNR